MKSPNFIFNFSKTFKQNLKTAAGCKRQNWIKTSFILPKAAIVRKRKPKKFYLLNQRSKRQHLISSKNMLLKFLWVYYLKFFVIEIYYTSRCRMVKFVNQSSLQLLLNRTALQQRIHLVWIGHFHGMVPITSQDVYLQTMGDPRSISTSARLRQHQTLILDMRVYV